MFKGGLRQQGLWMAFIYSVQIVSSLYSYSVWPRILQSDWYGVMSLLMAAQVFLSNLDLGLKGHLRHKISILNANKSSKFEKQDTVNNCLVALSIFTAAIVASIFFILSSEQEFTYLEFLAERERKIFLISLALLSLQAPFAIYEPLLEANQSYKKLAATSMGRSVIYLGFCVTAKKWPTLIPQDFWVVTICGLNSICTTLSFIFSKGDEFRLKIRAISFIRIAEDIRESSSFFLSGMAYAFTYYVDYFIIAKNSSLQLVGDFRLIASMLLTLQGAVQSCIGPLRVRSIALWANGNIMALNRLLRQLSIFLIISGTIGLSLAPQILPFLIERLSGRNLSDQTAEVFLLTIATLINILQYPFALVVAGTGLVAESASILFFQALIKIPLTQYLLGRFGLKGVMVSNIIISSIPLILLPYMYFRVQRKHSCGDHKQSLTDHEALNLEVV